MIKLDDVIEGMELESYDIHYYYHVAGDSIVMLSVDDIRYAEDEKDIEDAPEWQRESIKLAYQLFNKSIDAFITLPDKHDINEYRMMERFIITLQNKELIETL